MHPSKTSSKLLLFPMQEHAITEFHFAPLLVCDGEERARAGHTDRVGSSRDELHLVKLNGEVDVDKLQQIDELANSVGLRDTPVMTGQWKLQTIVKSPSSFEEWYWQLLAFVISAGTGALLFFQGT